MEVVCAWEGVFGGDLSIHLFEYKVIIMIDIIVVCCVGAYVFIISLELMKTICDSHAVLCSTSLTFFWYV